MKKIIVFVAIIVALLAVFLALGGERTIYAPRTKTETPAVGQEGN